MAYTPHVNGACLVRIGRQGDGSAHGDTPSDVGFTDAGPLIAIEYHKEPIIADNAGLVIPVDLQKMGKSAKITMSLVVYDGTVFQTKFLTDGANEGQNDASGTLIFQNDAGFRLIMTSPIDGLIWRFYFCSIDYARLRPGTRYNIWDVGIDAIAYIANGTTMAGVKLYDHTNA